MHVNGGTAVSRFCVHLFGKILALCTPSQQACARIGRVWCLQKHVEEGKVIYRKRVGSSTGSST